MAGEIVLKFAYPIKHYRQGYYYTTTFELDPSKLSTLESSLSREAAILRFLIVKDFLKLSEIPVEAIAEKAKEDKYSDAEDDKDCDYVLMTNTAMGADDILNEAMNYGSMDPLVQSHYRVFMERAFPPDAEVVDFDNPQKKSASILACRPQAELDYVLYVVREWQFGVSVNTMSPGPDKDRLVEFRWNHPRGNKHIHQYFLEEISVPGDEVPQFVVRRKEKGRNLGKDRIVVSREKVFHAIDEWHRGNGHMGQERTWKYCKTKYYNVTERLVRIYSETCHVCMKKNPVTRKLTGSIKPILSWDWRDRFQIDLIDFRKLRKRDPFGVLMRWVLSK